MQVRATGLVAVMATVAALAVGQVGGSAGVAQAGEPETVASVNRALDGVAADLAAMRRQLDETRAVSDRPPLRAAGVLGVVPARLDAAVAPLVGLSWRTVNPLLDRAAALRREARELGASLADWKRPSRPARPTPAAPAAAARSAARSPTS